MLPNLSALRLFVNLSVLRKSYIYGILAVHPIQSKGSTLGLIGVGLIILAAVISIGFSAGLASGTMLIYTSAYSGLIGRVVTGWLTINKKSFPAWVGAALIAEGVLNVIPFGSLANVASIVTLLAGTAAQLGYGIPMSQKK